MRGLKHGMIREGNVHGLILVSVRHKASRGEMKCCGYTLPNLIAMTMYIAFIMEMEIH